MSSEIRLPKRSQRLTAIGRTGTGKTVAGLWHLSNFNLDYPWVILNSKDDEHINNIEKAVEIGLDEVPGKKAKGLFVVRPLPSDYNPPKPNEKSPVEIYLWKIWARENIGVFTDEGYMIGNNPAFEACLTQGRSKRIPMITCTQRPVWVSRFCFSEADFFQVFDLIDYRDKNTVRSFVPYDPDFVLEEHHSFYFDVAKKNLSHWKPVPPIEKVLEVFDSKLVSKKRWV